MNARDERADAPGRPDVLLIANAIGVGGMTRYMAEHAAALVGLGVRLEVVIPESEGAAFVAGRLAGVEGAPAVRRPGSLGPWALRALVRERRPRLVRLCTGKAPPDTRLALGVALTGAPLLESLHLPASRQTKLTQRLFYTLRPKGRYLAINNTRGMHERAVASAPTLAHRMVQEPEGVDLSAFVPGRAGREAGREPGPVRLVSVSRLDEKQKDIATLIDAAGLLHGRGVRFELVIVGDGADRAALEERAAGLGVSGAGAVRFAGWVEGVQGVLAAGDVFVNSTKFESFGRTNIEAAACGLPVVASRVLGCTESVADGVNGVLVAPGDAPALAAALERLIADETERACLGAAGPGFAAGFSMEAHSWRVIELANEKLGAGITLRA